MDTVKQVTPCRFSTLPTLCWTDSGMLASPRITSRLSCVAVRGSYIFRHGWKSSDRTVCVTADEWAERRLVTFLSNASGKCLRSDRAGLTLGSVLLLAGPAGGGGGGLSLVSRCFSHKAWAQFPLTARVHPAEVPSSNM